MEFTHFFIIRVESGIDRLATSRVQAPPGTHIWALIPIDKRVNYPVELRNQIIHGRQRLIEFVPFLVFGYRLIVRR